MTKLHLAGVAVALLLPPIPLAAQEIDLVSGQVFSITTKGPSSIPGKPELMLQGVAFAVSDDTLLTSLQAIGSAADFNAREPFKKGGVADRAILLGESNQAVTVRQHSAYPAAVLVNAAGGAKLAPFKLSACSADAGTYSVQINAETSMAVRPTQAGQQVIDFRVLSTTDSTIPKNSLGAPVLRDGQVIGILTDVTPDGKTIGVIPIEEIAAVLPENIVIDCDPRSLVRIAKLEERLNNLPLSA